MVSFGFITISQIYRSYTFAVLLNNTTLHILDTDEKKHMSLMNFIGNPFTNKTVLFFDKVY